MNIRLQLIMIISSLLFLIYVIIMVRNKKIELKYILTWLLAGIAFIVISVFPTVLFGLSRLLNIIEPVNTLFLSIIFFMLLIIFTLTVAISRNSMRMKSLTQEIGIIKQQLEKLSDEAMRK
ncbi:MAG: DUF2304 domain-containing protein [Clostridiales bacterium]|nr:DUF2304 domain-containing protein [Clostridiales bacterium]